MRRRSILLLATLFLPLLGACGGEVSYSWTREPGYNYARLQSKVVDQSGALDSVEEFMAALTFTVQPILLTVGPTTPPEPGYVDVNAYFSFGSIPLGQALTVSIGTRTGGDIGHTDTLYQVVNLPGSLPSNKGFTDDPEPDLSVPENSDPLYCVNDDPEFVPRTINVPSSGSIADLNLLFDFSHPRFVTVSMALSHGTTTVFVMDALSPVAESNLDGVYTLDDEAAVSFHAAALAIANEEVVQPGSYRPLQALSAFDGMDKAGVWTLWIADLCVDYQVGLLRSWSLIFENAEAAASEVVTASVPAELPMFSVPEIRLGEDAEVGRYLDITNVSDSLPLHISTLQAALSSVTVDPGSLTYDGVAGLPWYTIIGEPTDFAPGETKWYDIPDEPPLTQNVYWRAAMSQSSADPLSQLVAFTPPAPAQGIPTVSTWGVAALVLLILTVAKARHVQTTPIGTAPAERSAF